jgi:enhancing lycopene biosynthesis protein 2
MTATAAPLKVGLVLAGCGFRDGAEIHESVLAMLALEEAGATVECYAPDKPQARVIDHKSGKDGGERRSVLVEAARIARGRIRPLGEARAAELDAVVIPGGFGAALNLCDFAARGPAMQVEPELERLLLALQQAGKPIGALCIAPAVLAKVFGHAGCRLTVGNDPETVGALTQLGATHVECRVDEICVDERLKLVTTPAYMLGERARDIHAGIRRLAGEVVRLARSRAEAGKSKP